VTEPGPDPLDEQWDNGGLTLNDAASVDLAPELVAVDPGFVEATDPDPTPSTAFERPRRKRYWLRRTLFALGAVFLLGIGYYGITLWQVWSTGHHDQARSVDAIVVMGAANYNGKPSPLLKARLDHALELYEAGYAPLVILTGGKQPGDKYTEAETGRKYLAAHGVPDDAMVEEDSGHSTWASMDGVASLMKDRGIERILIVTDPFHSLRSRLIAQELGLTAYTSPTETSPWGGGTQFKKSVKEAAGIAVGRVIGFKRLWKVTG
jgi:uncharacterized SAM-binding protein YcdF (DUF218 family)